MTDRIAVIHSHRIKPVFLLYLSDPATRFLISLFPRYLFPILALTSYRFSKPIRIIMNVLMRKPFWANMPAAERVLFISANRNDVFSIVFYFNAATRIAKITYSIMNT